MDAVWRKKTAEEVVRKRHFEEYKQKMEAEFKEQQRKKQAEQEEAQMEIACDKCPTVCRGLVAY